LALWLREGSGRQPNNQKTKAVSSHRTPKRASRPLAATDLLAFLFVLFVPFCGYSL
jgi:hypothetical protein